MEPKVIRIEIKVTRTMATVLAGLLVVALALLAVTSAGARPPLEGPGGQGGVTVASSVPTMISYQGQLLDSGGNPVPDGTYSMTFKLYNVLSGGTAFWVETHPSVQVTDGLFNVLLGGGGNPLDPSKFTGTTYLGVTVGSGPEMIPRQQIVSVGYAFQAKTDNDWDGAGTGKMYTSYLTDNVGIGTINPQTELHVVDTRKSTNPSDIDFWPNGILIESDSATPAPNHSPRLGLVDTSLGSITTAPAWYIGNWADRFQIFRQPDIHSIGVDFLNIVDTGNVGIGTRTPGSKLSVQGGVSVGDATYAQTAAPSEGMIIKGNVGIGTTSPGYNLHVIGSTRLENPVGNPGPDALYAFQYSNVGRAGYFAILNGNNPAPALTVQTQGTGPILDLIGMGGPSARVIVTNDGKVGIGTTDPHTKLQVAGPVATAVKNVNTSYTITGEDSIVVVTGGSSVYITLPSAVGIKGRQYTIKNMNNNDVTVGTTSWQVIDSNPTYLLRGLLLGGVGKSITVVSDDAKWLIISEIK